ncbi:MAG: protein rep [Streptococcus sp.]
MFEGLYRKRQIGFGKLFKTIKKELDLDDVEDGNLVQTGEDSQEVSRGQEIVAVWNWQRKNYFLQLLRNMLVSFIIRCI